MQMTHFEHRSYLALLPIYLGLPLWSKFLRNPSGPFISIGIQHRKASHCYFLSISFLDLLFMSVARKTIFDLAVWIICHFG